MARLASFDSIVSWYGTHRPEFRAFVRELPFLFLPSLPTGPAHAVEFYRKQVGGGLRFPEIRCPDDPRTFAVIHPFASNVARRAPIEHFSRIAAALSQKMPVHWLCGPEEHFENAIRIDDLYELACWLRQARIFIGNDSGISHLAAAVGTPVTAFFRTTDPRIWAPRGPAVNVINI